MADPASLQSLVTRNIRDFEPTGAKLFNPYE
jgi:hypothetical protein